LADLASWIALSLVPGVGGESYRRLLGAFGSPEQILTTPANALVQVVPQRVAAAIVQLNRAQAARSTLSWLEDSRNGVVTLADPDYPQALLQIADPPPLLYVRGRRELLNAPSLAVVGSRNASAQGTRNAQQFAQALSEAGLTVVSGMALGVDAAAHSGALAGAAASIAVAGTGLDVVYPWRHHKLADELSERGLLVSELPLGTRALAGNFPRRNRIISGLALGCLVVEAAARSGSLITARCALEQGRDVFAIPGSIHSPLSKGCHALIKQGAKLVESSSDILTELNWRIAVDQTASPDERPVDELLAFVGYDPCSLDALCARCGLPADQVIAKLLHLELEGRIASLPGGLYQRIE
jgi:DNA processing protein